MTAPEGPPKRGLLMLALAALLLVPLPALPAAADAGGTGIPWGDAATAPIRPGARIFTGEFPDTGGQDLLGTPVPTVAEWCTLGFFYEDSARGVAYASMAGHCAHAIREVRLWDEAAPFGEIVFVRDEGGPAPATGRELCVGECPGFIVRVDTALVRIYDRDVPRANPEMLGFGGPSGHEEVGTVGRLDAVGVYGHGVPFFAAPALHARSGRLVRMTDTTWNALLPQTIGDSGGPVLDLASCKAIGNVAGNPLIVSTPGGDSVAVERFGEPPATGVGIPVAFVLRVLHETPGFEAVRLATVEAPCHAAG